MLKLIDRDILDYIDKLETDNYSLKLKVYALEVNLQRLKTINKKLTDLFEEYKKEIENLNKGE